VTDDFGYLNARVRARRAELLPEGFFQEGLNLKFADLLSALGDTPYAESLSGEDLGAVDQAVARHLNQSVGGLPGLVAGAARDAVLALLSRADLINIKTIMRAKEAGLAAEQVKDHLLGGTLPQAVIEAMIEAPDAAGMVQALLLPGHPLSAALKEALQTSGDAAQVEVRLDRAYYKKLRDLARKLGDDFLQEYLAIEIDGVNLSTAFKLAQAQYSGEAEGYFVAGGRYVGAQLFARLAAGESEAMEELADTPLASLAQVRELGELERALRCLLLQRAAKGAFAADGAGLVTSFIRAKEWEAARIRLLARRSFYNLPQAAVEREVFCS